MTALIIDTSGSEGFAMVASEGKIVQQIALPSGRETSKFLFTSLQTLLKNQTLDFIAFGKGPGTFTGTRVGAIAAHSFAYGLKIPLVSFSSSLIPDYDQIASTTYQSYLSNDHVSKIDLVYISSTN